MEEQTLILELDSQTQLRLPRNRDAQLLFETSDRNRRHLHWMTWIDRTRSAQDSLAFIEMAQKQFADGSGVHLVIFRGDNICGGIGTVSINPATQAAEIGYWLSQEMQGSGLMTRCCRRLIQYLFNEKLLNRIVIQCDERNSRSQAVARRLGFTQEGLLRQSVLHNGELVNSMVFGLLRTDPAAELLHCNR